jgi:signal transduction histidine kinase
MTRRRWGLLVLAVAAVGYALGGEWQSIRGGVPENHLLDAAVGLSFFCAGIVALDRKPGNRIGWLMVGFAATWFLGNWGNWSVPVLPTLGLVGGALSTPLIAHLALSYPSGRVRARFDRLLLGAIYVVSWGSSIVVVLTWDPRAFGCGDCPYAPAVLPSRSISDAASTIGDRAGIVLVPLFLASILVRWHRASPAGRRYLAPLWTATGMLAVVYLIGSFATPIDNYSLDSLAYLLWEIGAVIEIGVPIVFLWGLLSARLARSAVGDLMVELESPLAADDLHAALTRTLGDPTLQVAYAMGEETQWVDASGQPVTLPTPGADESRTVTVVRRDAEPIAALVHDDALDQGLVRSVAAAAGMAIANERLRAEVRAQLAEVRASRQRIVEAGDRERRRVERNLHDGAQQRLVALSLSLAMLRRDGSRDSETDRALADASAQLRSALQELRELARGIHPAILTQEGLEAAVESLAERSSSQVRVTTALDGTLPAPVEATAYFVVCEALANVAKYAEAHSASVDLRRCNGLLRVEVADDGRDGADLHAGSGLLGLQDRVAAVGGSLHLDSPVGVGTRLVAEIPVDG